MTKKPDKYDEKLKADLAKIKADAKARIEAAKAESKKRTEKVKSLERLFASGKLTYEQYREMMKQVK